MILGAGFGDNFRITLYPKSLFGPWFWVSGWGNIYWGLSTETNICIQEICSELSTNTNIYIQEICWELSTNISIFIQEICSELSTNTNIYIQEICSEFFLPLYLGLRWGNMYSPSFAGGHTGIGLFSRENRKWLKRGGWWWWLGLGKGGMYFVQQCCFCWWRSSKRLLVLKSFPF